MTANCFYCGKPIADQEITHGKDAVAHRGCVQKRIAEFAGSPSDPRQKATHCWRGHSLADAYVDRRKGHRCCRQCKSIREAGYKLKKKAAR